MKVIKGAKEKMHTHKEMITTKKMILDTSLKLFRENDFMNVTISSICKEIGISRSLFYYHFKTKEQILSELFSPDEIYTRDQMAWIYSPDSSLERAIRVQVAFENYLEGFNDKSFVLHYVSYSIINGHEQFNVATESLRALLIPLIETAQKHGEIKNISPTDELCNAAIALQLGVLVEYCLQNGQINRKERLINNLKVLYSS